MRLSRIKGIFVTGTDTAVGKTAVTGCLARFLNDKGLAVVTQKWVQTGERGNFSSDAKTHMEFMGRGKSDFRNYLFRISPYVFKLAASPHLASRIENRPVKEEEIIENFRMLSNRFDFVLAEGAGGPLVPFNEKGLMIDIARKLKLPVLVVVANRLGAINQALMAIEAIRHRKMEILGLVFNNPKKENVLILQDNPSVVRQLGKEAVLGVLPRRENRKALYREFISIGNGIWEKISSRITLPGSKKT